MRTWLAVIALWFIPAAAHAWSAEANTDQYGGYNAITCPSGSAAHFYTQQVGQNWWICSPAGHGFFMRGITNAVYNFTTTQTNTNTARLAPGLYQIFQLNWSQWEATRLQKWGFNTLADNNYGGLQATNVDARWGTGDSTIPTKLPFVSGNNTTHYSMTGQLGCTTPIKDTGSARFAFATPAGVVYSNYNGYNYGDYFDPGWAACLTSILSSGFPNPAGLHGDYYLYNTIDEGDQTGGIISYAGPDFPSQPGGHNTEVHAGWMVLVSNPIQTSWTNVLGSGINVTYTDCKVYNKVTFVNELVTKYGTIGALNTAWGSHYTTFWSSQSGFTLATNWANGQADCSGYTSWGTGTGIIDENGSMPAGLYNMGDPCTLKTSATSLSCSTGVASAESAGMQTDMHNYLVAYIDQYLGTEQTKWQAAVPGIMLAMQLGGFYAPPRAEVLTEGAKYLDLPQLTLPNDWSCKISGCSDFQARLDFVNTNLGNRPYYYWLGMSVNADSGMNGNTDPNGTPYSTQAQRGQGYYDTMLGGAQSGLIALTNQRDSTTGVRHVVGFYWWELTDANEACGTNWGWVSSYDNAYDGRGAVLGFGYDGAGYQTGGEGLADDPCSIATVPKNYGDAIDRVAAGNFGLQRALIPLNGARRGHGAP